MYSISGLDSNKIFVPGESEFFEDNFGRKYAQIHDVEMSSKKIIKIKVYPEERNSKLRMTQSSSLSKSGDDCRNKMASVEFEEYLSRDAILQVLPHQKLIEKYQQVQGKKAIHPLDYNLAANSWNQLND